MAKERIGIMGGTFNPVHQGHVDMARAAAAQENLDKVLFLPTGNPPHKHEGVVDAEDRYRMVASAIAQEPAMVPSRLELERSGVILYGGYFDPFERKVSQSAVLLCDRRRYAHGAQALAQLREGADLMHLLGVSPHGQRFSPGNGKRAQAPYGNGRQLYLYSHAAGGHCVHANSADARPGKRAGALPRL